MISALRVPQAGDVGFEPLDHVRVQRGARIHAIDAHGAEQAVRDGAKGSAGAAAAGAESGLLTVDIVGSTTD